MEYKVVLSSIDKFRAWAGGQNTLNNVRERGGIDTLTILCEDLFAGSTPTETEINDWLWFEADCIYRTLGYYDLLDE